MSETKELTQEEMEATTRPEYPQEEKALAVRGADKPSAPASAGDFFSDVSTKKMWFNQPNSQAEALAIVKAMDDTDEQLLDCIGQVIECVNIIAHEAEFENDQKEIVSAIRTVLIDVNGKSYGSVATGVRDSVRSLFGMVGLPPYNPPIKLTPVQKKTRNGFRTLKLVPVV